MPTHLYCLLPTSPSVVAPAGSPTLGATLGATRTLVVGGVVAWIATRAGDRLPRDARDLTREAVAHDTVIASALAAGITPVPATLGDPYPDDQAVEADLRAREAEIVEALEQVGGSVEMAVIVAATAPVSEGDQPAGSGRAYLERLRDRPSRGAAIADELAARLDGLARFGTRRVDGNRVALSHLVDRQSVGAYRQAALQVLREDARILVDGPRAPYSFAAFTRVPSTGVSARIWQSGNRFSGSFKHP